MLKIWYFANDSCDVAPFPFSINNLGTNDDRPPLFEIVIAVEGNFSAKNFMNCEYWNRNHFDDLVFLFLEF